MLKLTKKTEYALMALRHIQLTGKDNIVSAREISELYRIPFPLLAKIMQELARKKIVTPIQGPRGGYLLRADLEQMSLRQFFETMEGPLGVMDCYYDSNCEIAEKCNIRSPIQHINESVRNMLDNMTVYEVTK